MKAVVRDTYGPPSVLKLEEIDTPSPAEDEVLVRVRASSLNRADRYLMEGVPMPIRFVSGFFSPKRRGMGMDFSGEVVAVGEGVRDVLPGAEVYGQQDFGETWAEYASIPVQFVAPKPARLTFEQAAAVPLAGVTALQGLRDHALLHAGQSVIINGATGAVGTFAVQVAKALGASVTAVCSERNVDLVKALGADEAMAYETDDFTACGRRFDVLFDIAGNRGLRARCRVVEPRGTIVLVGGPEGRWLGPVVTLVSAMIQAPFVGPRVVTFTSRPNRGDLVALTDLIEAGKVTPAIERVFGLENVSGAMRHLIEGRPSSKVVLSM